MKAIKVVITLNSPLLIARPENGDENSRTSLDYIPGSTIKGVVIKHYLQQKQISITDDAMQKADSDIREFFFSNQLQFLNGYLYSEVFSSASRALPTPASWFIEKKDVELQNTTRNIWDFALERHNLEQAKTEPRRYFWNAPEAPEEGLWRCPLAYTEFTTMVHNASLDPHQKSSTTSTVFRYELINTGQSFCAYIIAKNEVLLDRLFESVPEGKVWLGASTKSSYGETSFSKEVVSDWQEYLPSQNQDEGEITFTLQSDLIIKDNSGESSLDFSQALQAYLNLPDKPTPVRCFQKSDIVGGFNRKWGLPIIQERVIQKGSCFVYETNEILSPESDKIKELVEMGLGEHRSDGFGRIAVNLNHSAIFSSYTLDERTPVVAHLSSASIPLVKRMIKKRLDIKVNGAILKYVESVSMERQPENSQLQKLRNYTKQARLVLQQGGTTGISTFLDSVKKKESSFLQFDRRFLVVKGKRISWFEWIEKVWSSDISKLLELTESDWTFFDVVDAPNDIDNQAIKYRLIDSVAQKAIKTRRPQ